MTRCEERKKMLAEGDEAFNRMLAEVKSMTEDEDEQNQLLTERVLMNFIRRLCKEKTNKKIKTKKNSEQLGVPFCPESTSYCHNQQVTSLCTSASVPARNSHRKRRKDEDEYYKYNNYEGDEKYQEVKKRKASIAEYSARNSIKKKKTEKKAMMINKKPPRSPPISITNPPPPLPIEVKKKIESLGGYGVQLVTHKQLFNTDLSLHHDRLSMPVNQVIKKDFLSEVYEEALKNDQSIPVLVIDPRLKEHELGFKRWNSKNSFNYVLNRGWNKISADIEDPLKTKDTLQVWSFRAKNPPNCFEQDCLSFALVKLKNQEEQGGDSTNGAITNESNDHSHNKRIDSSIMTMKDEEVKNKDRTSSSASARQEAVESTVAEKQAELGARKHYVMNLKHRNVMFAKIETGIPVV